MWYNTFRPAAAAPARDTNGKGTQRPGRVLGDTTMDKRERIDFLVEALNKASRAYYGGAEEQMTNFEWDALFDELTGLEAETGYIRPDSPTQTTSHAEEAEGAGEKEPHEFPALSLAKTKEVADLQKWAGDREVWLSWKLDGLTLVLTYDGGVLTKILTRGNGAIGSNITYMKEALAGVPLTIAETGHFVVRGEATISYSDFERINDTLDEEDDKYANPRNLASGTLALDKTNLDKVRERRVTFNAFTLVHTEKPMPSWGGRMAWLDELGFITVERRRTDAAGIPAAVDWFTEQLDAGRMDIPVDGLVLTYEDADYAATGSVTGHHATRAGLAYKWQDEQAVTTLREVDWSCAASTITPVAVFDPVQLEGTTVTRASLCNISEMERLGIGENGKTQIAVIKANKIIPKCVAVLKKEGSFTIPDRCPVCQAPTEIRENASGGTRTLRCTNRACPAKHLKRFARFVSKTGMDIDGLSIQSLRVFVNQGFIRDYADIYHLAEHREAIVALDGFGERSYENLAAAIEKSRAAHPANFLFALCIPMIGVDAAKKILAALGSEGFAKRVEAGEPFDDVEGIGPERSSALRDWFADEENRAVYHKLLKELRLEKVEPKNTAGGRCAGLTFVITGSVHTFANRAAFKAYVESEGGLVAGSVSGKTSYLVNNDQTSASSKNKKAAELGVPILSEEAFIQQFGQP